MRYGGRDVPESFCPVQDWTQYMYIVYGKGLAVGLSGRVECVVFIL